MTREQCRALRPGHRVVVTDPDAKSVRSGLVVGTLGTVRSVHAGPGPAAVEVQWPRPGGGWWHEDVYAGEIEALP